LRPPGLLVFVISEFGHQSIGHHDVNRNRICTGYKQQRRRYIRLTREVRFECTNNFAPILEGGL
jgi:hypothetical protein